MLVSEYYQQEQMQPNHQTFPKKPRIMTPKRSKLNRFFSGKSNTRTLQSDESTGKLSEHINNEFRQDKRQQQGYLVKVKSLTIFEEPVAARIHDRRSQLRREGGDTNRAKPVQSKVGSCEYGFPFVANSPKRHGPKTRRIFSHRKEPITPEERFARLSKLDFTFR